MALLEVAPSRTFRTDDGVVKAVDGVSFKVEKGKTLGIVGESGSGKSVTCLTIMGLNARSNTITSGQALWKGNDLLKMNSRQLRSIRGDEIAMIFQDPMTSKPRQDDRDAARQARAPSRACRSARRARALKAVGIRADARIDATTPAVLGRNAPARDDRDGADQRPRPLIADEPTTARRDDWARILNLMTAPEGFRQRDHHDHARPRRNGRDRRRRVGRVRGARRRAGAG